MTLNIRDLAESLKAYLKQDFLNHSIHVGELSITVPSESVVKVLTFLRDAKDLKFRQLMDVTAVDFPERTPRFNVVYHLLSLKYNMRIRIKCPLEETSSIPSVAKVFSSANWFEREVWDMFGIKFREHPDLRRILTDYNFEGHPLRKDFPLTGYVEVRYDPEQKKVVYEPVKLTQAYRSFDFLSPWEGVNRHILADEKVDIDCDGSSSEKRVSNAGN